MKSILTFVLIGILIFSCSIDDDSGSQTNCGRRTLINTEEFANAPADPLQINSFEIEGDCLTINFSAGGCSGANWELELIDSEAILESNPPQRNLRLSLKNEEECLAYITKELTFDISNLKVEGTRVQLNLTNADKSILYEY